jgi:hypothetical protein
MEKYHGKTVEYWKQNAEENYLTTPISVLKYITVLEEQTEQLRKHAVVGRSGQLKCDCCNYEYPELILKANGRKLCKDCS